MSEVLLWWLILVQAIKCTHLDIVPLCWLFSRQLPRLNVYSMPASLSVHYGRLPCQVLVHKPTLSLGLQQRVCIVNDPV
jgi:hypothetical protein